MYVLSIKYGIIKAKINKMINILDSELRKKYGRQN